VVNFTYADVDGHIGYVGPGRVPIRAVGDGSLPQDGSVAAAIWDRYIPFDELPRALDPDEGFIVSANQRVGGSSAHWLGEDWDPAFRATRIRELITAQDKIGAEDLPHMHADVLSVAARQLLPKMLALSPTEPHELAALQLLRGWDGRFTADSGAAMFYAVWLRHLTQRLFVDELGEELASETTGPANVIAALAEPDQRWCDDRRTPAPESCRDQLSASLTTALAELVRHQGDDPTRWRLDRALKLRFSSRVMSAIPILAGIYTREVADWGDPTTVRVASSDERFEVVAISTFFGDFDLAPGGGAKLGVALGQGSHPLGPHFDDLLDAWKRSDAPQLDPPDPQGAVLLRLLP
jgi:penicillin G amidase